MPGSIVCNVCDGKDFYNEAGFYYCSECQTQTQEIREQVFDQQDNTAFLRTTKTTIRKNKSLSRIKLTSWEIFNYIIHGLVEEMKILGANDEFKEICYHLWINYLTKLEVLSKVEGGVSKLSACFRRRDAEIIFNRSYTRKRKKSGSVASIISSQNSTNELEMKELRRERAKRRRKLTRSEYDEYSNTNQSSETSIHNQTLSSLGSDNESVTSSITPIVFTKSARKELLKIMSAGHLNRHINDIKCEMKCHKFIQNSIRRSYTDINILTRNKLYSVIYLALLLTRNKFQLGDIIRFCREGHLSYLEYKHFFPDIISDNCIDDSVYMTGLKTLFSSEGARKQTWIIYKLLDLDCNLSPDLTELCKRYCDELNLPNEIFNIASNFINSTKPKFSTNKKTTSFPNYEGRVMAFIMFTLKALFGFDGATEYDFSNVAKLINKEQKENSNMFVFDEWYNYIQYRKVIIKNKHFPTKYLFEPNCRDSVDTYVEFIHQRKIVCELDEAATLSMKIARKYLTDLEVLQENCMNHIIEFKPTITPFRSYIDLLKDIENLEINGVPINKVILKDRSNDSVDFLINPSSYMKLMKSLYETIPSGKNTNFIFDKMRKIQLYDASICTERWYKSFDKSKMDILHFDHFMVKILDKHIKNVENNVKTVVKKLNRSESILRSSDKRLTSLKKVLGRDAKGKFCKKKSVENIDTGRSTVPRKRGEWFVSAWYDNPKLSEHTFRPSLAYQVVKDVETSHSIKLNGYMTSNSVIEDEIIKSTQFEKSKKHFKHYTPWLEYWINIQEFNSRTSSEKWEEFYLTLPKNFRWLLKECATITEQKQIDLFIEYVNVELYMCYVHLGNTPVLNKHYDNYHSIIKIIQKVRKSW